MKLIFTLLFTLTIFICNSQTKTYIDKDIIGNWTGTKKATQNGRDTMSNGKKMKNGLLFNFSADNSVVYPDLPPEAYKDLKYSIVKDKLIIGRSCYLIEKLTKEKTKTKARNPNNTLPFFIFFIDKKSL